MKRVANTYFVIFLHNLVMTFFVLLHAFNLSFSSQVVISVVALTYWFGGWILIHRKFLRG